MIDMDYPKSFFNVWEAGMIDAERYECIGQCVNHGFSNCIEKTQEQK